MKKTNFVFKKDEDNKEIARFYFLFFARLYCWFLNGFGKTNNYFVARLIC